MSEKPIYEELEQRIKVLEKAAIEAKQLQTALRESEEKFRVLADSTPTAVMLYQDNRFIYANTAAETITGYSTNELLGMNFWHFIHPEHMALIQERGQKRQSGQETIQRYELKFIMKDGTERWADLAGASTLIGGQPAGIISVTDITARKQAEDNLRVSEVMYRTLFETSSAPVAILEEDYTIAMINDAFEKVTGYFKEEMEGTKWTQYIPNEDIERLMAYNKERVRTQETAPRNYAYRYIHKSGELRHAYLSAALIPGTKRTLVSCLDITDMKKAERHLRESEARYRELADSLPQVIFETDLNGNITFINQTAVAISGYTLEEFTSGMNLMHVVVPEDRERLIVNLRRILAGEEVKSNEYSVICKDGRVLPIVSRTVAIVRNNQIVGMRGIGIDITDLRSAQEALRKSEERFRNVIKAAGEYIYEVDAEGRFVFASDRAEEMLGYTLEELLGKTPFDLMAFPEEVPWATGLFFEYVMNKSAFRGIELRCLTKTGQIRIVSVSGMPVIDSSGSLVGYQGAAGDITERKWAAEVRQESERRLSDIIEFLPDATLVIDSEGTVIAWNRAIETMTGIKKEDMLGKGDYEYALPFYGDRRPILIDLALHPDKEKERQYTAIQRAGDILFGEAFTLNLPSGDTYLSATASVLRNDKGEIRAAIECIHDNTERKRLEERLNRAEKMEGLGRLAGGVAHDLNNVLGVLAGYAELLLEKLPEDGSLRKYADNILQSSMRSAAIIQDLLTLARRGVTVSEVVDLNRLVFGYIRTPEFEKLKAYHPDVKVWTDIADGLLNIKGSPVHLSKTIMNLISNAAESVSGKGEVTIRTENRYLDQPIHGYDEMKEGEYVVLTVADTGKGISADDLGKIFEPFYTKKVMGRSGTGLGLSVVWGTVKDHHGYIDVKSEEDKGTTFTIYFPVTRETPVIAEKAVDLASYMGKDESILVVDDVKEQRELAISMLGRLGYRVEAVASGEEAIEYIKNKQADLMVLDMIMEPGMDGMETYQRILEINPGQRAVIASGFSETDRVRKAQEMGAGTFILKPYILEHIGLAVRRELDRK